MIVSLFFIALIALSLSLGILWRRIILIRRGEVAVAHLPTMEARFNFHWATIKIAAKHLGLLIWRQVSYQVLKLAHRGLNLLRLGVHKIEKRFARVISSVQGRPPITPGQSVSEFLQEIKDHQEKNKNDDRPA